MTQDKECKDYVKGKRCRWFRYVNCEDSPCCEFTNEERGIELPATNSNKPSLNGGEYSVDGVYYA
jgi:hypothetical protein